MTESSLASSRTRGVVLTAWTFRAVRSAEAPVLPDGCRDVIVATRGASRRWFTAELAAGAYAVGIEAGTTLLGLRLRPGARIRHDALRRFMEGRDPTALLDHEVLPEFVDFSGGIAEILECLATPDRGLPSYARALGVTPRTLQRTVRAATSEPPSFWSQLARVRRTARALVPGAALAELADEHGYADQSHMTREIARWMGVTPKRFAADPHRRALVHDLGYP